MFTLDQYFTISKYKAMDKKIVDKINELKTKEKKDKISKKVEGTLTQVEWATRRIIEKDNKVKFSDAWLIVVVKVVSEKFHYNFRIGYIRFGLGITCVQQRSVRECSKKGKNATCWTCPSQVITFHSPIVNERGKCLWWFLMALMMGNQIRKNGQIKRMERYGKLWWVLLALVTYKGERQLIDFKREKKRDIGWENIEGLRKWRIERKKRKMIEK